MNAAMLLKLSTDFEFFDGSGNKHHKGGEPPRVGLKVCVAKCGECEAKSDPWMMKRDAKADACMRLLPDVKAAYGDWNLVRTNRRNNPNPKSWTGPWQKQRDMKKKQNRANAAPYGNRPKHNSGGAGAASAPSANVSGAGANASANSGGTFSSGPKFDPSKEVRTQAPKQNAWGNNNGMGNMRMPMMNMNPMMGMNPMMNMGMNMNMGMMPMNNWNQ